MRGAVSVALVYYYYDTEEEEQDPDHATLISMTLTVVLVSTLGFGAITKPLLDFMLGVDGERDACKDLHICAGRSYGSHHGQQKHAHHHKGSTQALRQHHHPCSICQCFYNATRLKRCRLWPADGHGSESHGTEHSIEMTAQHGDRPDPLRLKAPHAVIDMPHGAEDGYETDATAFSDAGGYTTEEDGPARPHGGQRRRQWGHMFAKPPALHGAGAHAQVGMTLLRSMMRKRQASVCSV